MKYKIHSPNLKNKNKENIIKKHSKINKLGKTKGNNVFSSPSKSGNVIRLPLRRLDVSKKL